MVSLGLGERHFLALSQLFGSHRERTIAMAFGEVCFNRLLHFSNVTEKAHQERSLVYMHLLISLLSELRTT